jgi:hypothetical protein
MNVQKYKKSRGKQIVRGRTGLFCKREEISLSLETTITAPLPTGLATRMTEIAVCVLARSVRHWIEKGLVASWASEIVIDWILLEAGAIHKPLAAPPLPSPATHFYLSAHLACATRKMNQRGCALKASERFQRISQREGNARLATSCRPVVD